MRRAEIALGFASFRIAVSHSRIDMADVRSIGAPNGGRGSGVPPVANQRGQRVSCA